MVATPGPVLGKTIRYQPVRINAAAWRGVTPQSLTSRPTMRYSQAFERPNPRDQDSRYGVAKVLD
jgi:hypothetical protein